LLDKPAIHSLSEMVGKGNLDVVLGRVYLHPANIEMIKKIIGFADEKGLKILPVGNQSKVDYDKMPNEEIVVIRMDKFCTTKQVVPGDLYAILGAGYELSQLNKDLASHNLFFPFCFEENKGTVGGAVASGVDISDGESKINVKEYVLSLELVNAQAEVLRVGANVFKSVAGYDTVRLFVGSWGTLGVITQVGLRLVPSNRKKEFENMQPLAPVRIGLDKNSKDQAAILSLQLKKELDPKEIFLSIANLALDI